MYTNPDFATKKALKQAVKDGVRVTVFAPFLGPKLPGYVMPDDCTVAVEGPHAPKPHTWYAEVTVKGGVIVKVQ